MNTSMYATLYVAMVSLFKREQSNKITLRLVPPKEGILSWAPGEGLAHQLEEDFPAVTVVFYKHDLLTAEEMKRTVEESLALDTKKPWSLAHAKSGPPPMWQHVSLSPGLPQKLLYHVIHPQPQGKAIYKSSSMFSSSNTGAWKHSGGSPVNRVGSQNNISLRKVVTTVKTKEDKGDVDLSHFSSLSDGDIKYAVRLQAVVRGFLQRREMRKWVRDHEIKFNRNVLMHKFARLNDTRVLYRDACIYLFFAAFFFAFMYTIPVTSKSVYPALGHLYDSSANGVWSDQQTFFDIGSSSDLYSFINNTVISGAAVLDNHLHFNEQVIAVRDSIAVTQYRGYGQSCDSLYDTSRTPHYENGICMEQFSSSAQDAHELEIGSFNLTSYGNSSGIDISALENNDPTTNADIYTLGSAYPCPLFTSSDLKSINGDNVFSMVFTEMLGGPAYWSQWMDIYQRCNWIDRFTRRVNIEFLAFVGNENPVIMISVLSVYFDVGGHLEKGVHALYINMDPYPTDKRWWLILIEVLLWFTFLWDASVSLARAVQFMKAHMSRGLISACVQYFASYWHWHVWIEHGCFIAFMAIRYWHVYDVYELDVAVLQTDPTGVNHTDEVHEAQKLLHELGVLGDYIRHLEGMLIFMVVLRALMYFHTRGQLAVLYKTFIAALSSLMHFLLPFMVVYLAFALSATVFFGHLYEGFSTEINSLETLTNWVFGNFDISSLIEVDEPVAVLYFLAFMILTAVVLMNFFVAIVLEAYASMDKREEYRTSIVHEIVSNFHYVVEYTSGRVVPLEMVHLLKGPYFHKKSVVSLFEVKFRVEGHMMSEVMQSIVRALPEDASDDAILAVYEPPYLGKRSKRVRRVQVRHIFYYVFCWPLSHFRDTVDLQMMTRLCLCRCGRRSRKKNNEDELAIFEFPSSTPKSLREEVAHNATLSKTLSSRRLSHTSV